MFSKSCEYAIKIMIYISTQQEKAMGRVSLEEITEAIGSPQAFTAKILQQLARAGLLNSERGRNGGFSLPQGKSASLADIVETMDGEKLLKGCLLGFETCNEDHPCPVHYKFTRIRAQFNRQLESTSLGELRDMVNQEQVFLKEG